MPFTSWLSSITLTSGRPGMMATSAGTKMKDVSRPLKTGASRNFLSRPALEAERLADGVGGGQRQDRRAEDRDVQQAEAEEAATAARPASGASARAASCAVSTTMPSL